MVGGIAVIAALLIAILMIIWAVKVIKETLVMGLVIVLILAVLFFAFSITPDSVIEEFFRLPQHIAEFIRSLRGVRESVPPT
ncbi:MAG: hypothetical protein HC818_02860 [Synechococcaceae cyanobacterium RM1_1_27]|nr:hypothetical protein [Synechococcaceae cyanobacterium SM2_3_2]NJO85710.1 hypothetical protein [Synechococcaceae cyanobacterium RM1_1_27]